MRRKSLLLLLICASAGLGQVRYHAGDDANWAAPDFDDSSWPVSATGVIPPAHTADGMLWVRARTPIAAGNSEPDAVLWPANCGTDTPEPREFFLNGVRIAEVGRFPPHSEYPTAATRCVFPIPAGLALEERTAVIAIRTWTGQWGNTSGVELANFRLGRREALEERARSQLAEHRLAAMGDIGLGLLTILFGIGVSVAWRVAGQGRLLFWSAMWLCIAGVGTLYTELVPAWYGDFSYRYFALTGVPLFSVTLAILVELLWAAYGYSRNRMLLVMQALIAFPVIFVMTVFLSDSSVFLKPLPFVATLSEAALVGLAVWGLRRRGDGRLLAVGLLIFGGWILFADLLRLPRALRVGPFEFRLGTVSMMIFSVGVSAMLVRRAWRESRRSERLRGEIAAAREIQSSLMPAQSPRMPGFDIEAVYIPADEVGGDFYQVLPCGDGACVIVLGDVSGKGLKAAMVVSLVTGVLQSELAHTCDPARILSHLNTVLTGQLKGGFVTCCCLRLEAGGSFAVANAGHVAPYLGSLPLALEPGLPLGISTQASWQNAAGSLANGQTLVLMSDGVAEARRASGELYGFERVEADLARSSDVADIARRAQQFGQEDDITVLSITLKEVGAHVV